MKLPLMRQGSSPGVTSPTLLRQASTGSRLRHGGMNNATPLAPPQSSPSGDFAFSPSARPVALVRRQSSTACTPTAITLPAASPSQSLTTTGTPQAPEPQLFVDLNDSSEATHPLLTNAVVGGKVRYLDSFRSPACDIRPCHLIASRCVWNGHAQAVHLSHMMAAARGGAIVRVPAAAAVTTFGYHAIVAGVPGLEAEIVALMFVPVSVWVAIFLFLASLHRGS